MKFSAITTLALATASSVWASPVASPESVDAVVKTLRARTGAEYFHVGNDHVLRGLNPDYELVARETLDERQVTEWNTFLGEETAKRSTVDEVELVAGIVAERRSVDEDPNPLLKRQSGTCNSIVCSTGCGPCSCRIGNLSSRCG